MKIFNHIPKENIVAIVEYGSFVYGTANYQSDHDYTVIVKDKTAPDDQFILSDGDYSVYEETHFQKLLNNQYISGIEAIFTPAHLVLMGSLNQFTYEVKHAKLREEFSKRASNSFVKCKKKLTVETGEERIGLKSLYHSLRILDYGIQLAKEGKIVDFGSCNHHYKRIFEIGPDWEALKAEFQPIYNDLSSQFRLVAPK